MVAPQMKMSGRPTKMSSQLQQKNKIVSDDFMKYPPTVKAQMIVDRSRIPTGSTKKSTLMKPRAKHSKRKKQRNRVNQMKIVHNLDGKMGKNY